MSNSNLTAETATAFVKEEWSKLTLDAVEYGTVLPKLVTRDYEGEIKNGGDTVHIGHRNNYSARTKAQGSDNPITFESMTHGHTDVVVDTHIYAAFQVEKFAERQAVPGYKEKQTEKLGYALARSLEVAIATLFSNFSANVIGDYGTELTDADYLEAWELVANAGALQAGVVDPDMATVLSVAAYAAALRTERFINGDVAGASRGEDALAKSKVGVIHGSEVHMSHLLYAPSANQHACAMFHKGALALATQQEPETEDDFVIEQLATAVCSHMIYGKCRLTRPVETPGSVSTTDNFGVLLRTV